jgi:hypothetical protein
VNTINNWQKVILNSFAKLPENEIKKARAGQYFLLHEMVTGRAVTMIRSSANSHQKQKVFREKFDGELSEPSLREALEEKPRFSSTAMGTVTLNKLGEFLPTDRRSMLGIPICISLVDLGNDCFSLIVSNAQRTWDKKKISIPGFTNSLNETLRWSEEWHTEHGVPWGNGSKVVQLVQEIGRLIPFSKQRSMWLLLSISPSLAKIPWQDLIFKYFDQKTVVSIVPNFTWAQMEFRKTQRVSSVRRLGLDPMYAGLSKLISDRIYAIDGAAYVLGHGTWTERMFTSVDVSGGPLSQKDWEGLATKRVCIIHACWGGRSEDCLLGDLGGLPYNGFALGCRFFCAPVCEILPKTATVLHRHLTDKFGPPELGLRYLNAIREDPAVALYTIYGFANEPAHLKKWRDEWNEF